MYSYIPIWLHTWGILNNYYYIDGQECGRGGLFNIFVTGADNLLNSKLLTVNTAARVLLVYLRLATEQMMDHSYIM